MNQPSLRSLRLAGVSGIASIGMCLGGCAALPPSHQLAPPAPIDNYATSQSLAAPVSDWPSDHWWNGYGDSQLSALVDEGLHDAADLRIAAARFDAAKAYTQQARAALLPTLSAGAAAIEAKQSYDFLIPQPAVPMGWNDYGQGSLSLNWEIDFWGKNRAALAAAKSDAVAANTEATQARLVVATGIAAAYAHLSELYTQRDAIDDAIAVRAKTVCLMRNRQSQGLEHDGAVARSQAALAAAEGEHAAIDEAIALTKNALAALVGAGPDRGLAIERPSINGAHAFGLPANLPAELIGRRPDVVAARLRAEAASQRIHQARAAFYPNVNLVAMGGVQAMGLNALFHTASQTGAAGPVVTLPIFEGGRLRGQLRGAEAGYQAAVATYDGTVVEALREVADATASEHALGARLDRARAGARDAEAAWTVINNRYRGGLATYLDVLAAEDALILARRQVATLTSRSFTLDVQLVRALGGGFRA